MNKAPVWFYVLAGIALLWNLLGLAAVVMNFTLTPESIASLPSEQQQLYAATPLWSSLASLIAVITGSLGCVALLIRKAWAYLLFQLSIAGLIVQDIALFIVADAVAVLGSTVLIMQGFVALIAIGLLFMTKKAIYQKWIR